MITTPLTHFTTTLEPVSSTTQVCSINARAVKALDFRAKSPTRDSSQRRTGNTGWLFASIENGSTDSLPRS